MCNYKEPIRCRIRADLSGVAAFHLVLLYIQFGLEANVEMKYVCEHELRRRSVFLPLRNKKAQKQS